MIYVTHDQVEAMTLATRMAVMRGGRIQQIGTPGEVYARPANLFVAGFLGSPSMNFIDGEIVAGQAPASPRCWACGPSTWRCTRRRAAWPEAEVTLVEAMGAHEVVWLDMQGHKLSAIAPATGVHRIGDRRRRADGSRSRQRVRPGVAGTHRAARAALPPRPR